MFEAKCSGCGIQTTVPFKPNPGKPVYCRACFSKQTHQRSESFGGYGGESFGPKQVWARRRDNGASNREEVPSVFHRE